MPVINRIAIPVLPRRKVAFKARRDLVAWWLETAITVIIAMAAVLLVAAGTVFLTVA